MSSHSGWSRSGPWIGTFLLLGATLGASKVAADRKTDFLAHPLSSIDLQIAGFLGTDNAQLSEGVLAQLKPTSYLGRTYRNQSLSIDLFIAFYDQQRAGESMHSPKHCLPGAGWEIWNYGDASIPVDGRPTKINQYSIQRNGERLVVFYWYQSRQRIIASEYLGKLLLARDALMRNSTAGSIVRIIVPDTPSALQQARVFAADVVPQVQNCFGTR